jgi:hypothetical protein
MKCHGSNRPVCLRYFLAINPLRLLYDIRRVQYYASATCQRGVARFLKIEQERGDPGFGLGDLTEKQRRLDEVRDFTLVRQVQAELGIK